MLELNNSLICSNLPLSLFCKCSPKRCTHSLCNSEYTSCKVTIMTFYLRMVLLWIIDQYFLNLIFDVFYVFSDLGFSLTRHEETLSIQPEWFENYLYSVLVRLMEYHLFLPGLWKNKYLFFFFCLFLFLFFLLCFFTLSLLEINHSLIFCNLIHHLLWGKQQFFLVNLCRQQTQ